MVNEAITAAASEKEREANPWARETMPGAAWDQEAGSSR